MPLICVSNLITRLSAFLMGGSNRMKVADTAKAPPPDVPDLVADNHLVGTRHKPTDPGVVVGAPGSEKARRRSVTVQFDTRPPEIILPKTEPALPTTTSEAAILAKNRHAPDEPRLSLSVKNDPRARIFKLLIILALPTIVVFAQVWGNLPFSDRF